MIAVRELAAEELGRIAEIDRSEHVTTGYAMRDGQLAAEPVEWEVPRWALVGDGPHSVARYVRASRTCLTELGGTAFGAFVEGRLAGIAIFRPHLTETMAQLAALHVSRPYRRRGVATRLFAEVLRLARESGARSLYVTATPSESAVGFYLRQGFAPAATPHPALLELEPEDIHMTLSLE